MRSALAFLLVVFGILTSPGVPWVGVPMLAIGVWLSSRADHEDVSRFVGAIFYLGLFGFVAAFLA